MFNIQFSPQAQKDLIKLQNDLQKRIIIKLQFFAKQQSPLMFAKPLTNTNPIAYRFRVGDYRIIFYIQNETINIIRIRHRKEVYMTA
jgi:mRNA interferase RelE/StbE